MTRARWHAVLVALLTAVPLLQTLRDGFRYDDTTMIRDNPLLRGWASVWRVWGMPYWPSEGPDTLGLYRPLHVSVLAALWNIGHGAALVFHLYALTLHVVVALAVWHLLRRAASPGAALAGGAWFATHPLHVEAVASVANTSELLVAIAALALVHALHAVNGARAKTPDWKLVALTTLLIAAAVLSKESGLLVLPLALVTVWGWQPRDAQLPAMQRVLWSRRLSIAFGCLAVAVSLLARRAVLGAAVTRTSIAAPGVDVGAAERVVRMLSLWPQLLKTLAWPATLAPYYGPTMLPVHGAALATASVVVVLALAALAWRQARRGDRRPLVALAWVALTYLPASNLLVATGQLYSDRTLYGATIGIALGLAWAMDVLPSTARRVMVAVVVLMVAHGAVGTARYAKVWTSHRALWRQLIAAEPEEHLGYKLLGMDARARHDRTQAIALLGRAHAMAPSDRQIRFELGQALYDAGQFAGADSMLAPLLADADVRKEAAFVRLYLDAVGRSRGAAAVIAAAAPLLGTASSSAAWLYTGMAYEQQGDAVSARGAYRAGLAASPADSALRARAAAMRAP